LKLRLLVIIHAVSAAFVLPIAVIFFLSGALDFLGEGGESDINDFRIDLGSPISSQPEHFQAQIKEELTSHGIELPGHIYLQDFNEKEVQLGWRELSHDLYVQVLLKNPNEARVVTRNHDLVNVMWRLHEGMPGDTYKFYAVGASFLLILLSGAGLWLAVLSPRLRRITLFSLVAGIIALIIVVEMSLRFD
jgi:hypothetical protein